MLTERHFQSFAFPWRMFDTMGHLVSRGDGCLFRLPPAASTDQSEAYYKSAPAGWSRCPVGYAVYSVILPSVFGYRLIIPGLKIFGISTVQGHQDSLSIKTSAQDIERYVSSALSGFDQTEQFFQMLIERSVHEVRSINRDIVAATEDVREFVQRASNSEFALARVYNIRALSEILGSRADFLDYLSNPGASAASRVTLRPYQKFDKVVRSLKKRADDRDLSLVLEGASVGSILALPVFEVIPYLLIENAIKFSPRRQTVKVAMGEDTDSIWAQVENLGPAIAPEELNRVCEIGFRGENAVLSGTPGSGIGLFFVKDLVERHHEGTFLLSQGSEEVLVDQVPYRLTRARLGFKRHH